jgi:hypothetical protein
LSKEKSLGINLNQENWMLVIWLLTFLGALADHPPPEGFARPSGVAGDKISKKRKKKKLKIFFENFFEFLFSALI